MVILLLNYYVKLIVGVTNDMKNTPLSLTHIQCFFCSMYIYKIDKDEFSYENNSLSLISI